MKKSFVKMMNMIAEMENCILKGMVLDEHGSWVPIADRKAVEEDTLAHLSNGQVLFEGRWVTFKEMKVSRSRRVERPPLFAFRTVLRKKTAAAETMVAPAAPAPTKVLTVPDTSIITITPPGKEPAGAPGPAPETTLINKNAAQETVFPPETALLQKHPAGEPDFPPETAILQKAPAPVQESAPETVVLKKPPADFPPETAIIMHEPLLGREAVHDEFAPETKIVVFKPPEMGSTAVTETKIIAKGGDTKVIVKDGDTKIMKVAKTALPENTTPPANRMVLIVSSAAAALVIAAVIFVIVQMIR